VANWEAQPSYLRQHAATAPGGRPGLLLNSCESADVPEALRCSGHGRCAEWFDVTLSGSFNYSQHRLSFCECDWDWADPECRTPRKSQTTAFLLSLFLGVFGADQFYLGFVWPLGVCKLLTLGGLGLWWIYDVVRIGSSAAPTSDSFRLAADLPYWAFVLIVICSMGFLGFGLSIWSISQHRLRKARDVLLMQQEAVPRGPSPGSFVAAQDQAPTFRGYGAAMNSFTPRPVTRLG